MDDDDDDRKRPPGGPGIGQQPQQAAQSNTGVDRPLHGARVAGGWLLDARRNGDPCPPIRQSSPERVCERMSSTVVGGAALVICA